MPALFGYLIAVALLLGGGYGALDWLATPEPVKVVAKAKQPAPPPHYADDIGPSSTQAVPPQASLSAGKPEATSQPEVPGTEQVKPALNEKTASNDKAAAGDQPSPPQPQQPAAASQQAATAEGAGPAQEQDRAARAEMPQAAADQEARQHAEAKQHAEVQASETNQDNSAPAKHEEKQPAQAVSPGAVQPGNPQSVASTAPASAATTPKRPHVRQASRRSDKRPLEVMTLRTIELPDGRRMTQLIPYRRGDRYRDDGPAMAFQPDQ